MFGTLVVEKKEGKKYRQQRGRGFPIGLLESAAVPFLGEIAKSILKKVFNGRMKRR